MLFSFIGDYFLYILFSPSISWEFRKFLCLMYPLRNCLDCAVSLTMSNLVFLLDNILMMVSVLNEKVELYINDIT